MRILILLILLAGSVFANTEQIVDDYYSCNIVNNKSSCLAFFEKDLATLVSLIALDHVRYMTDNRVLLNIAIRLESGTVLFLNGENILECLYGTENHKEFKGCITDIVDVGKEV